MTFQGRPYDEVFSDLDEINNTTISPLEDRIACQQEIIADLLAACEVEVVELANLAKMIDPEQTEAAMVVVYAAIAAARPETETVEEVG